MNKQSKARNKSCKTECGALHRLGFMQGEFSVPGDFSQKGKDEIAHLFNAMTISSRGFRLKRKEANKR